MTLVGHLRNPVKKTWSRANQVHILRNILIINVYLLYFTIEKDKTVWKVDITNMSVAGLYSMYGWFLTLQKSEQTYNYKKRNRVTRINVAQTQEKIIIKNGIFILPVKDTHIVELQRTISEAHSEIATL